MASEAEWSLDFCLSCDKQSTEGPYCSQACRLADVERSGSLHSHSSTESSPSSSFGRGFHLPPAIDFSAYKSTTPSPSSSSSSSSSQTTSSPAKKMSIGSVDSSYFESSMLGRDSAPGSPALALSPTTRLELEQYESAFESSRNRRRRQSRQAWPSADQS